MKERNGNRARLLRRVVIAAGVPLVLATTLVAVHPAIPFVTGGRQLEARLDYLAREAAIEEAPPGAILISRGKETNCGPLNTDGTHISRRFSVQHLELNDVFDFYDSQLTKRGWRLKEEVNDPDLIGRGYFKTFNGWAARLNIAIVEENSHHVIGVYVLPDPSCPPW